LYCRCPTIRSQLIFINQVIPRAILERACGFAIFTIIKAGFLFSARGGGGIVIARLDNGCEPLSCSIILGRQMIIRPQRGLHQVPSVSQVSVWVVRLVQK